MRLLVILGCVALATASPMKKSINAKAIEPVDQNLDSLRPVESGSGMNVDRAKKDVTFCVEVRQDKSVVVDCADRQPIQPAPGIIPAPAAEAQPEPQSPQPESQPSRPSFGPTTIVHPVVIPQQQPGFILPGGHGHGGLQPGSIVLPGGHGHGGLQPGSIVLPGGQGHGGLQPGSIVLPGGHGGAQPGYTKPQTHTLNIEVPCEPEIATYVYQPPQEVIYAPTGNCYPQVPSVVQVPNAPETIPATNVPANAAPTQLLHIHGLHGHHGLQTLHGGHGLHHSIKPLHTQVVQPSAVQPSILQPSTHAQHIHTGVQCTCQSTSPEALAKSADAPMNAEALALKFLQDYSRAASGSGQPIVISGSAPGPTIQGSTPGATIQGSTPGVTMQGSVPGVTMQGSAQVAAIQGLAPASAMQGSAPASAMQGLAPASAMQGSAPVATIQGLAPASTMQGSAPVATIQGLAPASTMRYLPMGPMTTMPASGVAYSHIPPMSNARDGGIGAGMYMTTMPASGVAYSHIPPMSNARDGGIGAGMYLGGQLTYPGMMHMKALQDSFPTGPMVPSVRACRDNGEEAADTAAAAGMAQEAKPAGAEADISKLTPIETMDKMKKNDKNDKASRIARYIMEKDEAENRLDDN